MAAYASPRDLHIVKSPFLTSKGFSNVTYTLKPQKLKVEEAHFELEEKNTEIYKAIQNSSKFKNFYGKKAVLIDTLSDKEIEIIKVNWLINNYDTLPPNHYKFRNYTIKEEVKEEVVEPSTEPNKFITRNMNKEELQDKLKTLKSL